MDSHISEVNLKKTIQDKEKKILFLKTILYKVF